MQAHILADVARAWNSPHDVMVSPLRRTRETAQPLLDVLGRGANIQPWMEEIRLPGEWDGAPADQVSALLRASRERSLDAWWEGIPGGEGFREFNARITENLIATLADHGCVLKPQHSELRIWELSDRAKSLVFVGHGGTNAVAIGFLLGIAPVPWAWERFVTLHASITRLKASPLLGGFIFGLREHSDVGHLPRELRSR